SPFLRHGQRVARGDDSDLLSCVIDEPHLRNANALVDPRRVFSERTDGSALLLGLMCARSVVGRPKTERGTEGSAEDSPPSRVGTDDPRQTQPARLGRIRGPVGRAGGPLGVRSLRFYFGDIQMSRRP